MVAEKSPINIILNNRIGPQLCRRLLLATRIPIQKKSESMHYCVVLNSVYPFNPPSHIVRYLFFCASLSLQHSIDLNEKLTQSGAGNAAAQCAARHGN